MHAMSDRDPAFLWETEALRDAPQRVAEVEVDEDTPGKDTQRWMTLREANRNTGIPVETLRKWARRSTIPSFLSPTAAGTSIRMVDLDGVLQRATDLGRPVAPVGESDRTPDTAPATADAVADTAPFSAPPLPVEPAPPGTMIVPIDAWNKMLNQLGNLHEAGQQLAVAKERAAKAETEAKFLRERLAEMRREPASAAVEAPVAEPPPPATKATTAAPPEKVWQYLVRRARNR